jgi:ATP-dependent Clp protease ATP-binding subunit ClpB
MRLREEIGMARAPGRGERTRQDGDSGWGKTKMVQLRKKLDPSRTGQDADKLHCDLQKRIVGQEEAVAQIVNIYQMHLAGMTSPGRPIGNFLFLGPTGTGKTRMVEATAESLVGDARAVIKIDCGEFQHSHEIAKLIGSPPGYLGHRETHPLLSQEVLNQFHTEKIKISFVLFDEIEKASDALWNLLLGILDKGTLTLGDNRRVDFSKAMIFMTSNLGAAEMNTIMRPALGFAASETERRNASGQFEEGMDDKINRVGVEAARKKFTPEFMNRIDKLVVFRSLGSEELQRILNLELGILQQRIFSVSSLTPFVFTLTVEAKDFLLREGTDPKYGARHLKRAIERNLVYPISNLIASEQVRGGDLLRVEFDEDEQALTFEKTAENIPAYEMIAMADPASGNRTAVPVGIPAEYGQTGAGNAKVHRIR